jgi:hypothetical protein
MRANERDGQDLIEDWGQYLAEKAGRRHGRWTNNDLSILVDLKDAVGIQSQQGAATTFKLSVICYASRI